MTTREATIERVLPDIFYEDPEPVEDGMQQEFTITLLAFILRWWFSQRPDVFVCAGGFVFWNRANGNDRVGPDCYIALGADPDFVYQFPNYFVWEVGKPPDFVLEVASPSHGLERPGTQARPVRQAGHTRILEVGSDGR